MSYRDLGVPSLLDNVRVASPCTASWDDMIGDDRVRFCQECTKNVYNLSALSREDAEALLRASQEREAARGEGMCVCLYRRADGTVLTADCPEGMRRKKRRLALFGAVGGGLMAAGAAAAELFGGSQHTGNAPLPPLTGAVATMGEAPVLRPEVPPVPVPPPAADDRTHEGWIAGGPVPKPTPKPVSRRPPARPIMMGKPVLASTSRETLGLLEVNHVDR